MLRISDVKPGDTVRVLPMGMPICLEYNEKGVLSHVSDAMGYDLDHDMPGGRYSRKIVDNLQRKRAIPSRIRNLTHTCRVYGILAGDDDPMPPIDGREYGDMILKRIERNDISGITLMAFEIIEGDAVPDAHQRGARLQQSGFNVCRGFLVSHDMDEKRFKLNLDRHGYPFICGYYVASMDAGNFIPSCIYPFKIHHIDRFTNSSGYIGAHMHARDDHGHFSSLLAPYTDVIKWNLQKNSNLLVDDGKIVHSSTRHPGAKRVDRSIRCEFCGKEIIVPSEGYVRCPYIHCTSRMYPAIVHMMHVLGIDIGAKMDWEYFSGRALAGDVRMPSDVFNLPEYAGAEVDCTLGRLLDAICPMEVRRIPDFFDRFVEYAGSMEAVNHYIQNPGDMIKDMDFDPMSVSHVANWFEDAENVLLVQTVMDMPNIHIIDEKPVLTDVAQIFRNKTIYIDGLDFHHGSYSYVASILKSYGADIATTFDTRCNCVLLSHFTDPDGSGIVARANSYGIPVFEEDVFFDCYEIDKDLQEASVRV